MVIVTDKHRRRVIGFGDIPDDALVLDEPSGGAGRDVKGKEYPNAEGYFVAPVEMILKKKDHERLDDELVSTMAESFKMNGRGPINPILVRIVHELKDNGEVEKIVLEGGAHRLEAAKLAGFSTIDCKIFNGDETEARIVRIEENLFRKHLTVLDRAELLSEWAQLQLSRGYNTGQVVRKSTPGRPQGALSRFLQEAPLNGRSFEARRKIIQRSTKIAQINPGAKQAAIDAGLDNNQRALLKIAGAGDRTAQIKMVKDLAEPPDQERLVHQQVSNMSDVAANVKRNSQRTDEQGEAGRPTCRGHGIRRSRIAVGQGRWA